jgi:lysophosphatidate acyltransferase
VYVSTLFTVASCSFVAAVGMTLLGRPYETNLLVARMFYTTIHKALDLKVELEGEEYLEAKPAVYMSNHQSMIDVLILGR